MKFECIDTMNNIRPALNARTQHYYLKERKRLNGMWTEDDLEDVYPGFVFDGYGKIKEDPIHIFVPSLLRSAKLDMEKFIPSGIQVFFGDDASALH